MQTQFQPLIVPSFPAVIVVVDVAVSFYLWNLDSERKLNSLREVHEYIRYHQGSGTNNIPKRTLNYLSKPVVSSWPRSSMTFSTSITFPKY